MVWTVLWGEEIIERRGFRLSLISSVIIINKVLIGLFFCAAVHPFTLLVGSISIYNFNEKISNMDNFKIFLKFFFGWASAILGRSTKTDAVSNYWLYEIGNNC